MLLLSPAEMHLNCALSTLKPVGLWWPTPPHSFMFSLRLKSQVIGFPFPSKTSSLSAGRGGGEGWCLQPGCSCIWLTWQQVRDRRGVGGAVAEVAGVCLYLYLAWNVISGQRAPGSSLGL